VRYKPTHREGRRATNEQGRRSGPKERASATNKETGEHHDKDRRRTRDTNAHTQIKEDNPRERRVTRKQVPVGKHLATEPRRVKTTKELDEAADEGETTESRRCGRHARYEDTEHDRRKKRAQADEGRKKKTTPRGGRW
jgi:hypothetical protein